MEHPFAPEPQSEPTPAQDATTPTPATDPEVEASLKEIAAYTNSPALRRKLARQRGLVWPEDNTDA